MNVTWLKRLALACARHPRRTIGASVAPMVVAVVVIGALLGGALAPEGRPTNTPPSEGAKNVRDAAFPAASSAAITDIVVVRSSRYTVDAPRFRSAVRMLAGEVRGAKKVESVRSYLGAAGSSLV